MTRKRRTREQWKQLLEEWQKGSLSITDFCRQQGLTQASFYYWRRVFRGDVSPPDASSPWIEVTEPPRGEAQAWDMELSLPGGVVLRLRQA